MLNEHFSEVKEVLNKYHVNDSLWNFSSKYYDAYVHKICGDYLYEGSAAYKNSRFSWIKNFFLHSLFIILGAIVSKLKSLWILKPQGDVNQKARVLACPFCWRYVWFKRLPEMIHEPIRIIYYPLFHYDYYKKNLDAYDRKLATPEFYQFAFCDIIYSFYLIIRYYNRLRHCAKELDDIFGIYKGNFSRIFLFPFLYGGFIKRFIEKNRFGSERKVWLFDYDYDYKYIIFNNMIHRLRKDDVTIQIQHGSFVTDEPGFCNPVCDYSMCCSPREKKEIERNNAFRSNIRVYGAPLQTFDDYQEIANVEKKWDILFLLTACDGLDFETMKTILQFMNNYSYKMKVRYRPTSQIEDARLMHSFVEGMMISSGTSLFDDVLMSKVIICFSEDALYMAIRNNIPTIYVRDIDVDKYYDMTDKSEFFYIVNANVFQSIDIDRMLAHYDECNYNNDAFIVNNFGYVKLGDVSNNINMHISEILG